MHLTIAIVVPGFLALAWWQLNRALSGNSLSWAYVFEWPAFAGYAIYMWRRLTREASSAGLPATDDASPATASGAATLTDDASADLAEPEREQGYGVRSEAQAGRTTGDPGRSPGDNEGGEDEVVDEGVDEELARYNEYLAALNASGRRKHW